MLKNGKKTQKIHALVKRCEFFIKFAKKFTNLYQNFANFLYITQNDKKGQKLTFNANDTKARANFKNILNFFTPKFTQKNANSKPNTSTFTPKIAQKFTQKLIFIKAILNANKLHIALFAVLCVDFLALSYGISTLSISFYEASVYFGDFSPLKALAHAFTAVFGENEFALRTPFLLLHFLSAYLLYFYALKVTRTPTDAFLALLLFLLLPGTVASALIVNEASFVIAITLLILCTHAYGHKKCFYALLVLTLALDDSFKILYLSLFFYALYKKDTALTAFALAIFAAGVAIYGFDYHGKPRGYFLDTLGVFAACFSPFVFVYYFYVIYRLAFRPQKPLLWFLMSTTLIFCLIFSLRQRLYLEQFLPFCVIATPLLISTLMASYRVRMPKNRLKYKFCICVTAAFLGIFYIAIIFNTLIYHIISEPHKHFAYNYHFAKELALKLKEKGANAVLTDDEMQLRLRFYGIKRGEIFLLKEAKKGDENAFGVGFSGYKEFFVLEKNQGEL